MPGPGSRKRSRKGVSAWEGFDPWRGPCRRSFRADARDYLRSLLLSASGDDTLALTLHYNGATDLAAREMKLIFNSWNLQRIDNMNEIRAGKAPWHYISVDRRDGAGSGVGELTHCRRQSDAGGA